ncbi:MAG: hypothetical protein JF589_14985 [Gemmatimonadetes bacterium]|nr:hypothetical protein [Gemmatimonadota bacterium]
MNRALVLALLLAGSAPLAAQERFIAPTSSTVNAFTEEGVGDNPAHVLYVQNSSTVPIIVFGITLSQCENIRQPCGSRRVKIRVDPNRRVNVGRVEPRDHERGFSYRWNFSFGGDSTDAKAMAMLREHGMEFDPAGGLRMIERRPTDAPATEPSVAQAQAAPPTSPEPREPRVIYLGSPPPIPPAPPPTRTLRFKLGWGSILGWTQVPNHVIEPTGSCVDPAQTAKYEKDAKIEKMPWKPVQLERSFGQVRLPEDLRDSVLKSNEVLVRFVADTDRTVVPESVSVLESQYGEISVQVCQAVMSGTFEVAKNRQGQPVQSWVQTAVRIIRF